METKIIEKIKETYSQVKDVESKIDLRNLKKENRLHDGSLLLTSLDLIKKMVYYVELLEDVKVLPEEIQTAYRYYTALKNDEPQLDNEDLQKLRDAILKKN